jgi:hypothetical protein
VAEQDKQHANQQCKLADQKENVQVVHRGPILAFEHVFYIHGQVAKTKSAARKINDAIALVHYIALLGKVPQRLYVLVIGEKRKRRLRHKRRVLFGKKDEKQLDSNVYDKAEDEKRQLTTQKMQLATVEKRE